MDELTLISQLYAKGNQSLEKMKKLGLKNAAAIASYSPKKLCQTLGISETMAKRMVAHCTSLSTKNRVKELRKDRELRKVTTPKTKTQKEQRFAPVYTRIDHHELNSLAGHSKFVKKEARAEKFSIYKLPTRIPVVKDVHKLTMGLIKDAQDRAAKLTKLCFFWKPYADSIYGTCKGVIGKMIPKF